MGIHVRDPRSRHPTGRRVHDDSNERHQDGVLRMNLSGKWDGTRVRTLRNSPLHPMPRGPGLCRTSCKRRAPRNLVMWGLKLRKNGW